MTKMLAPDAPIGWLSAIAPPRTFTRSREICASLVHAAVTSRRLR
jgi:hypothetical protein